PAPAAPAPAAALEPVTAATAAPAGVAATGDPDARMTPAVRRLLREHGLTADQIVGTGGGGRITRDDVLAVVETIRTGGTAPVPVLAAPAGATPAPAGATPAAAAAAEGQAPTRGPAAAPAPGSTIAFPPGADEVLLPMTQMR